MKNKPAGSFASGRFTNPQHITNKFKKRDTLTLMQPGRQKVSFHEDGDDIRGNQLKQRNSRLTRWLIKYSGGVIKNAKQAQAIMALVTMILLGYLAIHYIQNDSAADGPQIPPGKTLVYPENGPAYVE